MQTSAVVANPFLIWDIYQYLVAGATEVLYPEDGYVVFGRADSRVASAATVAWEAQLHPLVVVTGGIGKDSGALAEAGIPEAVWLTNILVDKYDANRADIIVEPEARNGGENARLSLAKLRESGRPFTRLIAVAHATSAKRLAATLELEAAKAGLRVPVGFVPTAYPFTPSAPADQKEAVGELLRLADYPGLNFCVAQTDLPGDLVAYARELKAAGFLN